MSGINGKTQKMIAGIMAMMLLVIVLFSAVFIVVEAGHDCEGEDCHICICIEMCRDSFQRVVGKDMFKIIMIVPVVMLGMSFLLSAGNTLESTPVSRKVRLNN